MTMSKEEDLKFYDIREIKKAEDSEWIPRQKGYIGINKNEGLFIPEEDAYANAFERCTNGSEEMIAEFKEMLVEWFFSGDWLERDLEKELRVRE